MPSFMEEIVGGPTGQVVNACTRRPVELAMQRLDLTGRVYPVGGVIRVTHQFKVAGDQPVECLSVSMLPKGGALRRFIIKGKDFEVKSQIQARKQARQTYEAGTAAGHLSALCEADKDGLVTLSVEQIQPDDEVTVVLEVVTGVELRDDGFRVRFPFTIAPSYHPKAHGTADGEGGGSIELPKDVFGDLILPPWRAGKDGMHEVGFSIELDPGAPIKSVSSPSHRVQFSLEADGSALVSLDGKADTPNRDLVLEVKTKEPISVVYADESLLGLTPAEAVTLPKDAPRWLAVFSSTCAGQQQAQKRKVVLLIDVSGSMGGRKLEQARLAALACLSALDPTDEFGIVLFSDDAYKFHSVLVPATDANRAKATQFLQAMRTMGGTQLPVGLGEAVGVLNGTGGDIFLITDGEVFETGPIIEQMAACGTRCHALGINVASQDRFLSSLARRTGGVNAMVNPSEDVAVKALTLFATAKAPLLTDVSAVINGTGGKTERYGTVWQGLPITLYDPKLGVLPGNIRLASGGQIINLNLGPTKALPEGLVSLLWAAKRVEDLESTFDMATSGPLKASIEQEMTSISMGYGVASRAASLVAVVERVGDQPGEMKQTMAPIGMPEDEGNVFATMSKGVTRGLGLRGAPVAALYSTSPSHALLGADTSRSSSRTAWAAVKCSTRRVAAQVEDQGEPVMDFMLMEQERGLNTYSPELDTDFLELPDPVQNYAATGIKTMKGVEAVMTRPGFYADQPDAALAQIVGGLPNLLILSARLEADGGLPGESLDQRVLSTLLFGLAILKEQAAGIFCLHLPRMVAFLKAHAASVAHPEIVNAVAALIEAQQAPAQAHDWMVDLARLWGDQTPDQIEQVWVTVSSTTAP